MLGSTEISSDKKWLRLLGLLYILLSGFPYLWRFDGFLGKLQPPDLIFLIIVFTLSLRSDFYSFIRQEISQIFDTRSSFFSLTTAVLLYGLAVALSTVFNYNSGLLIETIGAGYLITLYFCLKYIFSKFELNYWKNSLALLGLIMAITGIGGWVLFLFGIDNPTGIIRDYPYLGHVFRLQGFTPTPAFFINLLGFIFVFVWTSSDETFGFLSRRLLLGILGFSLILTLSKSILLLFICIACYSFGRLQLNNFFKSLLALTIIGVFIFLQVATHFLFVSCSAAAQEKTLQDDTYVSNFPIYQNGDFCVLETNYLLYKRSATIAGFRSFPFGVGLGQHTYFLQKLATESAYIEKYSGQSGDSHSTYTGTFGELGFLGICAIILLFFTLFKSTTQLPPEFWWASLFFALEGINADMMNFRHVWIFIALVAAFAAKKQLQ